MKKESPIRTYYWTTNEGGMSQGTIVIAANITLREKRELEKYGLYLSKTSPYYWAEYVVQSKTVFGIDEFKKAYMELRNPYYDKSLF